MSELQEIEQATRDVLAAVHAVTDQVQPPENGRAMLLGIAAIIVAANLIDGAEPGAAEINAIWAERGFPWRMGRLQ